MMRPVNIRNNGPRIVIMPFDPVHVQLMDLQEKDLWMRDSALLQKWAKRHTDDGIGMTIVANESVIAVGGIDVLWHGSASLWGLFSKNVKQYTKTVFAQARRFLDGAIRDMNLHRLSATVASYDDAAIRWIEHLGFVKEATLHRYDAQKRDYYLYARYGI